MLKRTMVAIILASSLNTNAADKPFIPKEVYLRAGSEVVGGVAVYPSYCFWEKMNDANGWRPEAIKARYKELVRIDKNEPIELDRRTKARINMNMRAGIDILFQVTLLDGSYAGKTGWVESAAVLADLQWDAAVRAPDCKQYLRN